MLRIGTSGFSYPAWKGSFYPDKLPAKRMLAYYAERFCTVEINATFYRMPERDVLARWAAEVPAGFTFVLKAPGRITHAKRLVACGRELRQFTTKARVLGDKLGPLLFQLPPNFRADVPRLVAFLKRVPRDVRVAFEFRHPSWFCDETYAALRAHRAALCCADTDEQAAPLLATARFGYVRLRRARYGHAALAKWARELRARRWRDAYVFFKHEDEGTGPRFAAKLEQLARG
jgi:uncharacterized protein YecE (DUF72 family)